MSARYEIIRSVAKGGMAEVFRARTIGADGYGRTVAIKRISQTFMSDPQALEMLKDEARLVLQLNHPNIIQVFDFDRDDEGYFLVMEFVDGPDLSHVLRERYRRRQTLPEACAVAIAIDVLRGLDYAHRLTDETGRPLRVVHRDISPSNILLSGEGMVKLGDFGIAKAQGRLQTTAAGRVKGKMPYMSPEQVMGRPVDGRSDLFAVGLVLWECLAGRRCYDAVEELELFRRVSAGTVRSFEQVGVAVPTPLAEIVSKSLQVDLTQRYQSAAAMAHALERYHRRAHVDFGPEYIAALLDGTQPATQVSAPFAEDEETQTHRRQADEPAVAPDLARTRPAKPM